ncbi:hypothetical protein [Mesorhizobium loti]|uniref:hypothetical protein n=1 Tax=Rhizobium loti TaxID=381 RepID=UPI001FDA674B|nr:hypothetical protein [Mesorhizobium loti]
MTSQLRGWARPRLRAALARCYQSTLGGVLKGVTTMRIASVLTSIAVAGFIMTGAAAAATTAATTTAPATTTAAPAKKAKTTAMTPEKTAISKQCSALADAQKLHGKAREKFRADCKKNGGKAT